MSQNETNAYDQLILPRLLKSFNGERIIFTIKIYTNKKTSQFKKWKNRANSYFSKEDIKMINMYLRQFTSLFPREKQLKTILQYHFKPSRKTLI